MEVSELVNAILMIVISFVCYWSVSVHSLNNHGVFGRQLSSKLCVHVLRSICQEACGVCTDM